MVNMNSNTDSIPDEEAELYDRQIRLWGAEAQQAIRTLEVLVIGLKGVGAEVCKNLILSGVRSVTMMDHIYATEEDLMSQFFLKPKDVGKNLALAAYEGLQKLNPHVKITVERSTVSEKPISFFQQFNVVCVTYREMALSVLLNGICKYYNIKFFCADVIGMFGYAFSDVELPLVSKITPVVSLQEVLNADISKMNLKLKERKSGDPSFLIFRTLVEFWETYKRKPNPTEVDFHLTTVIYKRLLRRLSISDTDLFPLEHLRTVTAEFGPSCVIVAGFLCQEITRSAYESRPTNIKFFNPNLNCGAGYVFENVDGLKIKPFTCSVFKEEDISVVED